MLLLLLLPSVGLLTGCTIAGNVFRGSTANSRAGIVRARKFVSDDSKDGTLFWSHFDATKRSSIINAKADGTTTVLAEVTPDAAVQKSLDLLSKAKVLDKVDAEAQLKTASTIAQLGQRTANVNMLRDALYRIAEGANNKPDAFYTCGCPADGKPDATTSGSTMYERLFQSTLKTYAAAVKDEAEAEKAKAEAEKAKSEAEKAKAEAEKAKPKPAPDAAPTPKPSTPSDSTTATEMTLKLEMSAKTAPAKKKVKGNKQKVKK
ncbi:hypothetical protein I2H31_20285 [Hymenobacter sp. BT662]|uniref:Lipoprotein n=1 Tax=Hymenobacter ruricola TaxID=2791023 RepID=A0ABS0IAC0_9BACT|nr:hypothetical protein [Hymenobacter ruricola]